MPGALVEENPMSRGWPETVIAGMARRWRMGLGVAALVLMLGGVAAANEPVGACHVGVHELADGQVVDVGPSDGGLRWRRLDGQTGKLTRSGDAWVSAHGWTGRADGVKVQFAPCADGAMDFQGVPGTRIALEVRETEFESHGVTLKGRLLMPPGRKPAAVVVLLHGAERDSARTYDPLQRLLPAAGVGAFVYDKRGTGDSGGAYTQDFSLLADDAVAALATARRLAGDRVARIGFQGPSQGGWVAPIAATRASADFVIVSFGLAVSVLDEDREAIEFQMGLAGHGPEEVRKALEISDATGTLLESGFTEGFERFDAVRARYRHEPWFKDVYGNFTHIFLGMTIEELRAVGPTYRWGTPFRYDPMATLAALRTPQLWVLGGQDIDAPSGETARRLRSLIAKGRPVTLALYPTAEHGLTEFETGSDGARLSTRYAAGYFQMLRDFARTGRICPPYGDARIEGAAAMIAPPRGCRP
jgi:pimeloyl-ACP methyl ester carboxylesterase